MKRRVLTPPWCPRCNLNEDDTVHVLSSCEEAQRIWCCCKVVIRGREHEFLVFVRIFMESFEAELEAAVQAIWFSHEVGIHYKNS